jgi:phosphate acyltransferase
MKKIAVDAMGGDFAPKVVVEGAIMATKNLVEGYQIILVGKQSAILECLRNQEYDPTKIEIVNADEVIEMDEHPTRAFSTKQNSSIAVGFKLVKSGEALAFCSAG